MKTLLHTLSTIFLGCNILASVLTPKSNNTFYTDRFIAEPKDGTVIEYSFLKKAHTNLNRLSNENTIKRLNTFNCYNTRAVNYAGKLHI